MLVISIGAFAQVIFLVSIVTSLGVFQVNFAPNSCNILHEIFTSLIAGILEIVQIPSINNVAGIIATAAFFAPLIITSPLRRVPPCITNLSKRITSKLFISFNYYFSNKK